MMKLSMITDEVTQDFDEAVRFAAAHGLSGLELRTVADTPVDRLGVRDLRAYARTASAAGLEVCALASSFYKCELNGPAVQAEMAKLERLCDAADALSCSVIRGFAFLASSAGRMAPETLAPYFDAPLRLLSARGKTLVLEADPSVNTPNHRTLAALVRLIGSPRVRVLFDPGNCLYDLEGEAPFPEGYDFAKPYLAHIHIKDAVREGETGRCVRVGTGSVDYPALLRRLVHDGYDGWLSMETHYRPAGQLTEAQLKRPGGAAFTQGGMVATAESLDSLRAIMKEACAQ